MAAVTQDVFINFIVDYDQLQSAQKELEKSGKIDLKGFNSIQAAIDTTATDTKGLIKTFKDVAGASVKMGKTVEDAFGAGIQDALDEAGVSLKEFEATLKKANAPAVSLKKELLQLKEAMARMKAEGKDTGKEFDSLRARAGKLSDAISDANAEIKNAGSDTRGIDNVVGSISALAGGYAAVQGAAALFGEENEDLQKSLLKVNGAMALASGLQQTLNALQKEGALTKLADSVATKASAAAQYIYTAAVGTSTGALKAFKIALLATGIGAIIVLIGLAASAMGLFGDETDDSKVSADDFNKSLAEQNRLLKINIDALDAAAKLAASRAKGLGANSLQLALDEIKTEEKKLAKIQELELQARKDANKNRLLENKEVIDNLNDLAGQVLAQENKIRLLRSETINLAADLDKKAADDAAKKREENQKKAEAAIKKAREKELAEIDAQVKAQLAALDKLDEQERISFENREEITEEGRTKIEAANKKWDDLRLEQMEFLAKSSQIAAAKAQADEDALFAKRIKNAQQLISIASKVADFYSQLSALATEQETQRINDQKNQLKSLEEAGAITEKQAKIRRQQIDIAERKAKQQQAQREKQAAVFRAILAIPTAFLQGLVQGGIYLAAVYAALAAAEAALVASKPIPKFYKGKKDSYSGPGMVGDQGAELVERNGRMFLYTKPTQTYLGAKDKVYTAAETRNIMHNTNVNTTIRPAAQDKFDYDRLGKAIPKDSININIDRDFISEAVANGLSKNNYFTNRYQFKK